MELKHYAAVLWRWRALLILATIVAAGLGYWRSSQTPPVYRTSATVIVGQFLTVPNPGPGDLAIGEQLAQSYVQLVHHQPLLQASVQALGLDLHWDDLADRVAATYVVGTPLLDITVTDTDPQRAKSLADEIARQLVLQVPAPFGTEQQRYREFARQQLATLREKIQDGEGQLGDLQNQASQEPAGPAAQAIESRIEILQGRLAGWRNNYASLLDFFKNVDPANSVRVLEQAALPTRPVAPVVVLDVLLAAVSGLLLASLAAFLIEYLDDTLNTSEDVLRVLNQRTLGTIARLPRTGQASDHLVTAGDPLGPLAEAYRVLRTNVQFSRLAVADAPMRRLLVASAAGYEGKTLTACNLAITMALASKRVILCDTDLRRPTVHRLFGASNRVGLTTLLLEDALPVDTAVLDTRVHGLRILPSGPLPPNPAELLGSAVMERRLGELAELADVLIFDSPAVLGLADSVVLATRSDAVVLVTRAGRTRSDAVKRCIAILHQAGANVLGVVLNGVPQSGDQDYYSYARAERAHGHRWWRFSAAWNNLLGWNR
jgi:capsular exopolysaccharide synthesis family protein